MDTKQIAHAVLEMISKQTFKDWYEQSFEDYICGEEDALTKQQIINDLEWFLSKEIR
jgi:hypothetical protein